LLAIALIFVIGPAAVLYGLLVLPAALAPGPRAGRARSVALAVLSVGVLMYLLPAWGNEATRRRMASAVSSQILPAKPIAIAGDILLSVHRHDRQRPPHILGFHAVRLEPGKAPALVKSSCGALCVALLRTPGVTSVTVDLSADRTATGNTLGPLARTYRRSPTHDCGPDSKFGVDDAGLVEEGLRFTVFPGSADDADCTTQSAALSAFDYRLYARSFLSEDLPESDGANVETRIGPRAVYVRSLEITDRVNKPLLRVATASAPIIVQPAFPFINLALHGPRVGLLAFRREAPGSIAPKTQILAAYTNIPSAKLDR
jgi:hypothetical protein